MKLVKIGDIYRLLYVSKNFVISLTDITGIIIDTTGSTAAIPWDGIDPTAGFCELSNGVYYYDWNTSTGSVGRYSIKVDSSSNPGLNAEAIQLVNNNLNDTPFESLYSNIDTIKTTTNALPDAGALTSIAKEATLGVPTGASISIDIANLTTLVNILIDNQFNLTYVSGVATTANEITDVELGKSAGDLDGKSAFMWSIRGIIQPSNNVLTRDDINNKFTNGDIEIGDTIGVWYE